MGSGIISLSKRLKLVVHDDVLYDGRLKNEATAPLELVLVLVRIFEGKEKALYLRQNIKNYLNERITSTVSWDNFFNFKSLTELGIEVNGPFIRFLKALMIEMLSPAVQDLRNKYYSTFPFQSLLSTWKITVDISEKIKINHHRTEEAKESNRDEYFNFDWDLMLEFKNLNCSELEYIDMGISEVFFHHETTRDIQFEMQTMFARGSRGTGSFRRALISLPPAELLGYCLNELRKHETNILIEKSDNEMLNGCDIVDLLECPSRTLSSNSEKIPDVTVTAKKFK
eukprot:TRINITY_DN13490_c0_g1_i1.p1 TRINITY_DN13490_c0_g1~~TRINITY_DN13490_c0_g1_i1.p1  ORF type:complete len:325 (+),score=67.02 TRINITY_DN13490_c0_g1_i1:124-975(+)